MDSRDDKGRTPLMLAAMVGSMKLVSFLLKLIGSSDQYHQVQILLEAGANTELLDYTQKSAIQYALDKGHKGIASQVSSFDTASVRTKPHRAILAGIITKFWIDAICINQDDLDERSTTVARMYSIFSQAQLVLVWLGRDDGSGKHSVTALAKLSLSAAEGSLASAELVPYREQNHAPYLAAGIPYITRQEWVALAALYSRQNFRRLWCLQEMVMNNNVIM